MLSEKVLEIERQVESLDEDAPKSLIKRLIQVYDNTIQHYANLNDTQMKKDLSKRLQSVLNRPYVKDIMHVSSPRNKTINLADHDISEIQFQRFAQNTQVLRELNRNKIKATKIIQADLKTQH